MRIVIAGQTYYPGNNGQAIFTIHLAEGLAQAGHETHMFVPNHRLTYAHETINGVHLHKVQGVHFGWMHPEANLGLLPYWQVRGLLEQIRPDVVHLQDHYFLARDVLLAARGLNIPVLGTNHFLPENVLPYLRVLPLPRRAKIGVLWALMHWTYATLEEITTPTRTAANILDATGIRVPVTPVSCGVDTRVFQPAPHAFDRAASCRLFELDPNKTIFLYVGRLDREKRIDLLLRGMAELLQDSPGVQLAIAGQGAAKEELTRLAQRLGVEQHVHFLGYVPNELLPRLYQTAHVFAMPSPEELQSIATLEAMASGLPVLAADARALPELVADGVNGRLFAPGQADALAVAMRDLLARRADWPHMGLASRERARAHSLENTIRGYEETYARLSGRQSLPAVRPEFSPARVYVPGRPASAIRARISEQE